MHTSSMSETPAGWQGSVGGWTPAFSCLVDSPMNQLQYQLASPYMRRPFSQDNKSSELTTSHDLDASTRPANYGCVLETIVKLLFRQATISSLKDLGRQVKPRAMVADASHVESRAADSRPSQDRPLNGGPDEDGKVTVVESRSKENEDESESIKYQAPDGGYGWFVVLGCFVMHIIMGGLDRSEGILFLLLLDTFGKGAQVTSWPGAIVSTLQLILGPLAHAACVRYSVRASVMLGGFLASIGLILNCFAPNIYFLFFSHALIGGIGRGLVYAPGLVIVNMYFDKRVGLAAGLGTSGVGFGTFFIVPLTQFFSNYYGFTGTYLLLGAMAANFLVAAMLFRPLSTHYRITERNRRGSKNGTGNGFIQNPDVAPSIKQPKTMDILDTPKCPRSNVCSTFSQFVISTCLTCFPRDTNGKSKKASKRLFHFYLLKEPPFLLFCISILLFAMAFRAAFTFMPALVKSKGISESDAALALSVAGAVDSVGRIAFGLILDTALLRPYRPVLYTLTIFGVATVAFILPFLKSFATFCVFCGLFGLFTGAFISQKSVVLVDILEPRHMSSSLGLLILFQGLGNLAGPPIAGYLKDNMGTFDEAFYLGGGLLGVSGLLMVVSNILLRISRSDTSKNSILIERG